MRVRMMLAGVAAAGFLVFPAMAEDGQYAPQLNQMLTEAAAGTCLAALMAPPLLDACNAQIAGMATGLSALGPVETVTFVSAQDTPGGRVETYNVKFAGGQTMTWFIGQEAEGKFAVVGTGG